jgi:hypothetical protein
MTICSRLLEILQEKDTIAGILKKLNNEKGTFYIQLILNGPINGKGYGRSTFKD